MESSGEILPVSIRVNPLKQCDLSHLPVDCAVPWSPHGLYFRERPSFTLDPLFHAGAYYVQDASAMFVGWVFRQVLSLLSGQLSLDEDGALPRLGGLKVLDLCAAPGGKTTDIAASLREALGPDFLLVSNEVIRSRAAVLADNVAIWGDPNVVVCSSDPAEFGKLRGMFDIIVADVPCSGEGMFRKSENAVRMWSEDNVALCASRQRRIVADVWDALAPGGVLVYSTCTFNDAENDDNVGWIADELGGEVLTFDMPFEGPQATRHGFLLHPDRVRGEGQYCAAIRKGGSCAAIRKDGNRGTGDEDSRNGVSMFDRNGEIYALPDYVASAMPSIGKKINVLSAGVHAFTVKGKDRIPCADLCLSALLDPDDFPTVELTRQEALQFLHKDSLNLHDAPAGYVVVTYGSLPLGFVKNLGNRANNLHPASRRILMNIE